MGAAGRCVIAASCCPRAPSRPLSLRSRRAVGTEIWYGGETLARCDGWTTLNTSLLWFNNLNSSSTSAGTVERLIVDLTEAFQPGGGPAETDAFSELELRLNLGDAADEVVILGSAGDDTISAGIKGVSVNTDADVDIEFAQPYRLEIRGNGGRNTLSALGGFGAGSAYQGPVTLYAGDLGDTLRGSLLADALVGGAGNDVLDAREGADAVDGGSGNDTITTGGGDDTIAAGAGDDSISSGGGNDAIDAGAGRDTVSASDGDDSVHADDDEADASLNLGAGIDTIWFDAGIDPSPIGAETRFES